MRGAVGVRVRGGTKSFCMAEVGLKYGALAVLPSLRNVSSAVCNDTSSMGSCDLSLRDECGNDGRGCHGFLQKAKNASKQNHRPS